MTDVKIIEKGVMRAWLKIFAAIMAVYAGIAGVYFGVQKWKTRHNKD